MKPRIGVTLDWQEAGTFSKRPHYALRQHYFAAISAAGGLPLAIAYDPSNLDEYLSAVDALVIPGGFFASPTDWYVGEGNVSQYEESPRLQFDLAIIKKALEKNIPLLGICAGMQLLGGVLDCKMTHNVHEYFKTDIDHINGAPAEQVAHDIDISPDSLLYKITGKNKMGVNSAHREAVVVPSDKIKVAAKAPDGTIEAIEVVGSDFALGVQWHPEFFIEKGDPNFALFEALVKQAGK